MTKKILQILIILAVAFPGCKKCKEELPETFFSSTELSWMVYEGQETITFQDSSGADISFTAQGYESHYDVDENNCVDKESEVRILSFISAEKPYDLRLVLKHWSTTDQGKVVGLSLDATEGQEIKSTTAKGGVPFLDLSTAQPDYSSFSINNTEYKDVFKLSGNYLILFFNQEKGIVGINEGSCCNLPKELSLN